MEVLIWPINADFFNRRKPRRLRSKPFESTKDVEIPLKDILNKRRLKQMMNETHVFLIISLVKAKF